MFIRNGPVRESVDRSPTVGRLRGARCRRSRGATRERGPRRPRPGGRPPPRRRRHAHEGVATALAPRPGAAAIARWWHVRAATGRRPTRRLLTAAGRERPGRGSGPRGRAAPRRRTGVGPACGADEPQAPLHRCGTGSGRDPPPEDRCPESEVPGRSVRLPGAAADGAGRAATGPEAGTVPGRSRRRPLDGPPARDARAGAPGPPSTGRGGGACTACRWGRGAWPGRSRPTSGV